MTDRIDTSPLFEFNNGMVINLLKIEKLGRSFKKEGIPYFKITMNSGDVIRIVDETAESETDITACIEKDQFIIVWDFCVNANR